MAVLDPERMSRIKQYLRRHPRGMTITDVSSQMHMNRNLVAKYLDMLLISGQVDMQEIGTAKVYFLSHRIPISAMLDFSSDMVLVLDNENWVVKVNESMLAALGQDRESVVGVDISDSQHPLLVALKNNLPLPGSPDSPDRVVEICCVLSEKKCHFRVKLVPMVFEDGGRGITLIIEDITHQVAYQEQLRMSEARYRGIVEDQTEFIVRCMPDGTATFVNAAYSRYLEESVEHLVGKSFIPGIRDEDTRFRDQAFQSLSRDSPVSTFECRIQHHSGQVRWNTWTLRALFDRAGSFSECQGVGRDITEKREAIAKVNRYVRGMGFLSQSSMALVDMSESDDIYDYIVRQVHSLAPVPLVWLGIIDESTRNFVLKSIVADPALLEAAKQPQGAQSVEMPYSMSMTDMVELIHYRSLVRIPPGSRLLNMQIPGEIWRQIAETTGETDTYLMGLVSRGRLTGNVGICRRCGSPLPNKDLLEAFIRQAAIAIDRRIASANLTVSLAREKEQVQNLLFLSRAAMDFVEMGDSVDIYRYIADRLYDLIPESLIGIYSYDPGCKIFMLRAIAGEEGRVNELCKALGIQDPFEFSFPLCKLSQSEMDFCKSTLFEVPSLYDGFFHQVPEERCVRAEKELNLARGFCMGFARKGKIFGGITIGLLRPGDIANREIIEAFVNQASVALLQRCARERHRESEELFRLLVEQMPYPTMLLGRDGRILDVNRLTATLFGCPGAAELIGRPLLEYVECGAGYPPGRVWPPATSEGGEPPCRVRLRSSSNGARETEVWGMRVQYGRKAALCLFLRPLSPEEGNGDALSPLPGGSAGL